MNKIETALLNIGVPANQLGFKYLCDAISLVKANPTYIRRITTRVYPRIAETNDTSPSRVDRAIRHSIETAFDRAAPEMMEGIFGNSVSARKGKPTNGEFIATMVLYLRED